MAFLRIIRYIIGIIFISVFLFPGIADASEWELKVTVEKAEIRQQPYIQSPVVSTVTKGSILQSYEKIEDWFRVITADEKGIAVIGYIHKSTVEILKAKLDIEEEEEEEPEFFKGIGLSVKLAGGANYFLARDINEGTKGLADSFAAFLSSIGSPVESEIQPFHRGYEIGGDLIFNLTSKFGIGLGLGYIYGQKKSDLLSNVFGYPRRIMSTPRISAFPLRLGLFIFLPIHRLFNITFNSGAAYYFASYIYNLVSYFKTQIHTASANGFGFHGGIGLEINLNSRSALFLEYQGRYARIGDFKGIENIKYGPLMFKEEGTLYYLEGPGSHTLAILKDKPTSFDNVRKAEVDFSGFALRAGLRLRY